MPRALERIYEGNKVNEVKKFTLHASRVTRYGFLVIVPIFLPHFGCDRRCIYCDQGYITDVHTDDVPGLIKKTLGRIRASFEVGLYGGNIFGVNLEELKILFEHFEEYSDLITNFRISTKPTPLNEEILRLLKEKKVTIVELGMPCFNDGILERVNRGHTVEDFYNAFYLLKEKGFRVAIQVMVGLPGETVADVEKTAEEIIRLSPDYIRIYPLVVLKDTSLHRMYEKGVFAPIPFEEAVDRAVHIYVNALKQGIKAVKMGLTESEAIRGRIVAGHYHPAFGYLVKSRAFYLAIKSKMEAASMEGEVEVHLNNRDIPHLLGNKRSNLAGLEQGGVRVAWQKTGGVEEGFFVLRCGPKAYQGSIFDLCQPAVLPIGKSSTKA
jgi:histone acetyltransferase (RNA polymerase elongator complex component)